MSIIQSTIHYQIQEQEHEHEEEHEPPSTQPTDHLACFCYIIANGNNTYNGYTVNLKRRIRQHNGELKGGARATLILHNSGSLWTYLVIMTSKIWSKVRAMQHEWTIRYPTRKKPRPGMYQGVYGRLKSLEKIWEQIPSSERVLVYVDAKYKEYVLELIRPEHVTLTFNILDIMP
jgi:predicted GIY-YIG superfamily endonuclease